MNRFAPYTAFVLRLAVGTVFLRHGLQKWHMGVSNVSGFLHTLGLPFSTPLAAYLIAVETIGAAMVLLGILTRPVAALMALNMVGAIAFAFVPHGRFPELEGLLLAASLALVALGDGPLSVGIYFKRGD